jgi:hypothetical protein
LGSGIGFALPRIEISIRIGVVIDRKLGSDPFFGTLLTAAEQSFIDRDTKLTERENQLAQTKVKLRRAFGEREEAWKRLTATRRERDQLKQREKTLTEEKNDLADQLTTLTTEKEKRINSMRSRLSLPITPPSKDPGYISLFVYLWLAIRSDSLPPCLQKWNTSSFETLRFSVLIDLDTVCQKIPVNGVARSIWMVGEKLYWFDEVNEVEGYEAQAGDLKELSVEIGGKIFEFGEELLNCHPIVRRKSTK